MKEQNLASHPSVITDYPPKFEELFSHFLNSDLSQERLVEIVKQARSEMSEDVWSELYICVCSMVPDKAQILAELINPNYRSGRQKNWMPLHAAIAGQLDENVILDLIKRTRNLGALDTDGRSALHLALINDCSFEAINTLCNSGVDYCAPDEDGMTPLHLAVLFAACKKPAVRKKIIERLVYKDHAKLAERFSQIRLEVHRFFRAVRRQGRVVKEASVAIVNAEGKTPLDIAYEMDDQPTINIIKEAFFIQLQQITDEKLFKEMVDCYAKHFSQAEWTNMFFHDFYFKHDERGLWFWHLINPWYSDHGGNTMMDMRECLTNAFLIKLLEEGASIEHRSQRGNKSLLETAMEFRRWDMLETLRSRGVDINRLNKFGSSYLYNACYEGDKQAVRNLLKCKADPNVKTDGVLSRDETPLHGLCLSRRFSMHTKPTESTRLKIARMLIEAGADVEAQHNGKTPIDVAREWGRKELVELLENARRLSITKR